MAGQDPPRVEVSQFADDVDPVQRPCGTCGRNIVNDCETCSSCNTSYHPSCGKSAGRMPNGLFKRCCGSRGSSPVRPELTLENIVLALRNVFDPQFNDLGMGIDGVKGAVSDLDSRFTAMSVKVDNIEESLVATREGMKEVSARVQKNEDAIKVLQRSRDGGSSNPSMFTKCVKEVEERARRSKNLMIFGSVQNAEKDVKAQMEADEKLIHEIFELIPDLTQPSSIVYSRVGKYSPQLQHPRPIMLPLNDADVVKRFIQAFSRARTSGKLPASMESIKVGRDQTVLQRQEYTNILQELRSMKETSGSEDWRIATRDGSLVIVPKLGARTAASH